MCLCHMLPDAAYMQIPDKVIRQQPIWGTRQRPRYALMALPFLRICTAQFAVRLELGRARGQSHYESLLHFQLWASMCSVSIRALRFRAQLTRGQARRQSHDKFLVHLSVGSDTLSVMPALMRLLRPALGPHRTVRGASSVICMFDLCVYVDAVVDLWRGLHLAQVNSCIGVTQKDKGHCSCPFV